MKLSGALAALVAIAGFSRPLAMADNAQPIRIHVVGIVGHKNYDTITKPLAGASVSADGVPSSVMTDANGWATITTDSCEVRVTARGFEPARRSLAPTDSGPGCPNSSEVSLMSISILMDVKLRRYVDVKVLDSATGHGLAGARVSCVLYYYGSGEPRLANPKVTDARGRARITAYVRLDVSSNLWWTSLDRIDVAVTKPHYASEIDTIPLVGSEPLLGAEIILKRL